MKKGKLIVISGPSGTGKGTICKRLLPGVDAVLSISMTTRAPRPGEREGVSYFFTNRTAFSEQIRKDGFLEYAEVYGEYYGTPREPVERHLREGRDVILEIDMQGAMQVKAVFPKGIFIFIIPPSMAELRRRIEGRGSESPEKVQERLNKATGEIGYLWKYDYVVVNDDLDRAVADVSAILRAERLRVGRLAESVLARFHDETI